MKKGIPTTPDLFDQLTNETSAVLALAGLIEAVGMADLSESSISQEALMEGVGAVARVIVDKTWEIQAHAEDLFGTRQARGGAR